MPDWYCTRSQAKTEIKVEQGDTTDDAWIAQNIPLLSTRMNVISRLRFVPWLEKYYYDAFGPHIDDVYRKLDVARPLLFPTEVIDAFNNSLVLNTDYVIVPQDSPSFDLQLISTSVYGWSYGYGFGAFFWIAPGQFLRKIKVTGIWGYRQNYPFEGWTDSLQTVVDSSGLTATQTSFSVTNVNDIDANAQSPAIDVGNLLQIVSNDATPVQEWMQVIAVDTQSSKVTVVRGVNGSTASTHATGAKIYTWSVQPEINRAVTRALGYWYARRGQYEAVKNDLSQAKTLVYPEDLPPEFMNIVAQTRDWRPGVI